MPHLHIATALASASVSAIGMSALFAQWIKKAAPPELYYMNTESNLRLLLAIPLLWRSCERRGRARAAAHSLTIQVRTRSVSQTSRTCSRGTGTLPPSLAT
jgi:hypothetical protein